MLFTGRRVILRMFL